MDRLAVLAALFALSACATHTSPSCFDTPPAVIEDGCPVYKSPQDAQYAPAECTPAPPPADCAPPAPPPPPAPPLTQIALPPGFQPWAEMPIEDLAFVIGDTIQVTLPFYEDEDSTARVAPDGNIYLALVGSVRAAGRTPSALERELRQRYAEFLRFPDVGVVPSEFESRLVYVGGQVSNPGAYPLSGPTGALEGVFQAGGFQDTAHREQVVLIRRGPNDLPMLKILNLKEFALDGTPTENTILRPFDIIFVPRSPIAKLNLFVRQYITQVIPFNHNFNYVLFDQAN